MSPDKQFRADLVDLLTQTLTRGMMKHINAVLEQYDYSGDDLLYTEYDESDNPVNIGEWDFRPMNSNRPIPDPPYLLVGRVMPWSDDDTGPSYPNPNESSQRIKDEDELIVSGTTTSGRESGYYLIDGLRNFRNKDITINQYVARLDEDGSEVEHTFTQSKLDAHMILLQDPIFYDTLGGESYEIYHTTVQREYNDSGNVILRFAMHNKTQKKATLCVHAMRHYFNTLKAKSDMIEMELDERADGETAAWTHIDEVGDITDASRLLDENEVQKGVQNRHEMQVSLRVAEVLLRRDAALEGDLNIKIEQPST